MNKEIDITDMSDYDRAEIKKILKIMADLGIQSITTTEKTTIIIQDGDVIIVGCER